MLLNLLTVISWAVFVLWLATMLFTLRGLARQKPIPPIDDETLTNEDVPFVSILVPARDEEHRSLVQSLHSFLSQDYENFEVVAVNDRSTDKTGLIMQEIAKSNKQLKVVEGAELPDGWLGKPHALQQAFETSRGEWVLATDADMIFDKRAVRTAMVQALKNDYDALTFIPHINCLSFWECVFMPTFGWYCVMAYPTYRVNNPERSEAMGVGGFFLIKRASLNRVGQYKAVKAEVAEDLRTAEHLKRSGARLHIEYAPDLSHTRMQTNLKEIWEGFTKNLFAGSKFSLSKAMLAVSSILLFAVAPPVLAFICALLILFGGYVDLIRLLVPLSLVYALQIFLFTVINHEWKVPVRYALTVPLGHALFVAILINSTIRIISGKGVVWKGRKLYERTGVKQ
jgi:chlorobactene glucosyltransferase